MLGEVGGHVTLLEWLRGSGLTGCKEGCAEGECGACAVLVAREEPGGIEEPSGIEEPGGIGDGPGWTRRSRWVAINACLVPAAAFDQQEVVTAEGLGRPGQLHPVQREMAERGGSQCGYCTPGFICSMAAEYYRPGRQPAASSVHNGHLNGSGPGDDTHDEHGPNGFDLHALSGNLCRCTGYRPIKDAAYALGQPEGADPFLARLDEPAPAPAATATSSGQGRYVRPASLAEALGLLAAEPDARLVAGSTDWGVELNIRHTRAALTVGIDRLPELREFTVSRGWIDIGAALSLSEIEARLAGRVPLLSQLLPQFASRLIRNGATLGGNLGTASPIGDTPPALLALDVSLVLASSRGEREVRLAEYFTGYRQSVKRPDELIKTIRIPLPVAPVTAFHKIAKRRFDDISGVAVAYALTLGSGAGGAGGAGTAGTATVESVRIGLGGVAATPLRALAAEEALTGRPWTREVVTAAAAEMAGTGTPMSDHRASQAYRIAMLRNSLLKFYSETEHARTREGARS
ncbi:MAG TPA: FAD binding domain-containing protein [Streptosporangiaceae bacterium]|nr:FAD binding domain-containing protein [Streptosporangiaceae bacterium]